MQNLVLHAQGSCSQCQVCYLGKELGTHLSPAHEDLSELGKSEVHGGWHALRDKEDGMEYTSLNYTVETGCLGFS